MGITHGDYLIDIGHRDITPEQEREIEAREECERRGIDADAECADGDVVAWMIVAQEIAERSYNSAVAIRDRALEDAAKIADEQCVHWAGVNADRYWQSHRLAGFIRAMKEPVEVLPTPPAAKEG